MNKSHSFQSEETKIFFSCAGLGMGNASRISAVIESLTLEACQKGITLSLTVCSWGAGFRFLKEFRKQSTLEFELIELKSYHGNSLWKFILNYLENTAFLKRCFKKYGPDLVVLDSDYHFFSYLFLKKPIVYIGQALDVLMRMNSIEDERFNSSFMLNLFLREKLDSIYQKIVSTVVLVPSFTQIGHKNKKAKIQRIPLIVRREFLAPLSSFAPIQKICVLLSGSELERESFMKLKNEEGVKIISPNKHQELSLAKASDIDSFQIVFTQGGLSSLSEVIARRKYVVSFPMENHPEQILNARELEKLALGIKAELRELDDLAALENRIQSSLSGNQTINIDCTGADQSAQIIMEMLRI